MFAVPNKSNSRFKQPGFPLFGGRPFQPQDLWFAEGAEAAGFVGDPFNPADLFTTFNGSTNVAAAGDMIGRWARKAGSFDWSQSVSGNRVQWARHPKGGIRNILAPATASSIDLTTLVSSVNLNATTTATTIALAADSASYRYFSNTPAGTVTGRTFTISATMTAVSGATSVAYRVTQSTDGANQSVQVADLSAGPVRVSGTLTLTSGVLLFGIDTRPAYSAANGATTVIFTDIQVEESPSASAYQQKRGEWDVTEPGQPSVWLPWHGGSAWLDSGVQSFGSASLFADAGQEWTTVTIARTVVYPNQMLTKRNAATGSGEITFAVGTNSVDGGLNVTLRDAATNFTGFANGDLHFVAVRWNRTNAECVFDGASPAPLNVGTGAETAANILAGARNLAAPAGLFTGRLANFLIDRALTNAEIDRLRYYVENRYGVNMA